MGLESWKYKNISILILTFTLSFVLGNLGHYKSFIFDIGLIAAFLSGALFISTFTAPLAAVTFLILAEKFPLYEIWIVAALGAVIMDFFFFNSLKDNLAQEIEPIYESIVGKNHFHKVLNTKHFRWLFPVIGALIILSPFPKAPGIHLLGIPKLTKQQFITISFLVNLVGIAFILFLSFFIKP